MMPVAMRKLELIILNRDMDVVLSNLGESGFFQLAPPDGESANSQATVPSDADNGGSEYLARLERAGRSLGYDIPLHVAKGSRIPDEGDENLVRVFEERTEALVAEIALIKVRLSGLHDTLDEAHAFAGLKLPFADLDRLSFLSVRIGSIDPAETDRLALSIGDRGMILPLDESGQIIAASSRKGRFALDTDLGRAGFRAKEFPEGFEGIPPELPEALGVEIDVCERRLADLNTSLARYSAEMKESWTILHSAFTVKSIIQKTKGGLESFDFAYRLNGWVPRDRVRALVEGLALVTESRIAIRSFAPEELENVRSGKESVPVLLRHGSYVGSFDRLVLSYGAPLYGTIDPTPIVAFFFVLLFAVMFGDIGQGAIIFFAGMYLARTEKPGFLKFKVFAPIFKAVGTGSVIMGFLDGSVFANEKILVPAMRSLTGFVTGHPVDRIIQIMPESGVDRLFMFFGFTLCMGLVINSIGLVINIINKFRLGKPGEACFGKTGLAGAFFFWWTAFFGIRMAIGSSPSWIDIPGFGLPILTLFFSSSLEKVMERHHHAYAHVVRNNDGSIRENSSDMAGARGVTGADQTGDRAGIINIVVGGLVELIESFSYYISNTMSFLRVGAFALSHAVLSFVVFTMGELLRVRAPAGIFWEILVFIIGNAVIIVLEGLIVTIQVVRLQYYEFFSKFFTDTGKEFMPFGFGKTRSGK